MGHEGLEPILATGRFRLNSGSHTDDLRLMQSDGGHATAPPVPTLPAVQDTPSTRWGCTPRPSAWSAVANMEWTESGPLIAVGHPTDEAKTICAIIQLSGAMPSGPGPTTLNSLHPSTCAWCRSMLGREAGSNRHPAAQTREETLVPGAGASLPYSP